jgi:hypothetical protein
MTRVASVAVPSARACAQMQALPTRAQMLHPTRQPMAAMVPRATRAPNRLKPVRFASIHQFEAPHPRGLASLAMPTSPISRTDRPSTSPFASKRALAMVTISRNRDTSRLPIDLRSRHDLHSASCPAPPSVYPRRGFRDSCSGVMSCRCHARRNRSEATPMVKRDVARSDAHTFTGKLRVSRRALPRLVDAHAARFAR